MLEQVLAKLSSKIGNFTQKMDIDTHQVEEVNDIKVDEDERSGVNQLAIDIKDP
jgi:hypothetical protein